MTTPFLSAGTALCKCGCGQRVKQVIDHGKVIEYKPGHHKVKGGVAKYSQMLKCGYCGKEDISRGRKKFCSKECLWKSRGLDYVPEREYNRSGSRAEFKVCRSKRLQRLYLFEQRQSCDHCGWKEYPTILEVHHVNHNQLDGRLENLKLLCPTCHDVLHMKEQSGKFDNSRIEKTRKIRESLGLVRLPGGHTRSIIQSLIDSGKLVIQ